MASLSFMRAKVDRLELQIAGLKVELAFARLICALKAGYDPNQPRDDQGRWADTGGGDETHLAQGDRARGYRIDLHDEEARGGHTISEHVGKSPEYLTARLRQMQAAAVQRGDRAVGLRVGSFPTLESATRLVNSTIAQNRADVDLVTNGIRHFADIRAEFGSVTGYEIYGRTERSEPYLRDAYGVTVIIRHDPTSANGYRVVTAFPRNFDR